MALKYKIGGISGSVNSPSIPITVWDDGFADITAAQAIALASSVAPASIFDALPDADRISVEEPAGHIIRLSIPYTEADVKPNPGPPPAETGTVARSANFQAQSKTIFHALEPIGAYDLDGDVTDNHPHTKWQIRSVAQDGFFFRSEGMTVDPLPVTRRLDYYVPNYAIGDAYLDDIEEIVGHFNSTTFFGRPQGSVQLVDFSISQRSADDYELSFGFGYKAPRSSFEIDGITIPELRGSWIYWTREVDELNTELAFMERRTDLVVVQRVWEESDFATILDLPEVTYPTGEA